jgi:hypothetical protein
VQIRCGAAAWMLLAWLPYALQALTTNATLLGWESRPEHAPGHRGRQRTRRNGMASGGRLGARRSP